MVLCAIQGWPGYVLNMVEEADALDVVEHVQGIRLGGIVEVYGVDSRCDQDHAVIVAGEEEQ